jgi:NAD(P)-dependent dehydrogenase (short-subunit alcohol dehydrogenase family)
MTKHAIVTGAAGNLGQAVTSAFLDIGFTVHAIISPRNKISNIKRTGLFIHQLDLMSENEALKIINNIIIGIESIDLVIMTVGGFTPGRLQDVTLTDIEKMYRLNFITAFNVAKVVLPYMERQKTGGQLVFIGARPAMHPEQAMDMVAYALSKSLVFRLSEIINESEKRKNIRSYVIVPGVIDTPQNRTAMPSADFTGWVKPEEIARQIVELVLSSDKKLPDNILEIFGNY